MSSVRGIGHRFVESTSAARNEAASRPRVNAQPRIKAGSVTVYEAFNGFYLYGQDASTTHQVCLGCLGDGSETPRPRRLASWGSEAELAEAYGFLLVDPTQPDPDNEDAAMSGAELQAQMGDRF